MVWLSGLLSYAQCAAVLKRIGGHDVSVSTIWRQSQVYGARLHAAVEQDTQQRDTTHASDCTPAAMHDQPKALSMDGGMVNIRGEGWRELKVGTVFDVELRSERSPQTKVVTLLPHGVNVQYTAVLGSKDDFKPALQALASDHQFHTARQQSVVADGAVWIWDLADDIAPNGHQVVDWFHAVEHLSKAATVLYPRAADENKRKRWLKTHKAHLYAGDVHRIITALTRRNRADLARYFERHQQRMQYRAAREQGVPIGSGTVESGVKQYKQRLCGTGMRWNRDSAQQMLVIRSASLSDEFDALWQKVA
jgi:hypothetical protein